MSEDIIPEKEYIGMDNLKNQPPQSVQKNAKFTAQKWSQFSVSVIASVLVGFFSPVCLLVAYRWQIESNEKRDQWMAAQSIEQSKLLADYNLDIWCEQKQMDLDQRIHEQRMALLADFNKSFAGFQTEIKSLIKLKIKAQCGDFLIASGSTVRGQDDVRQDFNSRNQRCEMTTQEFTLNANNIAAAFNIDSSLLKSLTMTVTKIGNSGLTEATQLKLKKLSKSTKPEYDNSVELSKIIDNEISVHSFKALDESLQAFATEINKKILDAREKNE